MFSPKSKNSLSNKALVSVFKTKKFYSLFTIFPDFIFIFPDFFQVWKTGLQISRILQEFKTLYKPCTTHDIACFSCMPMFSSHNLNRCLDFQRPCSSWNIFEAILNTCTLAAHVLLGLETTVPVLKFKRKTPGCPCFKSWATRPLNLVALIHCNCFVAN